MNGEIEVIKKGNWKRRKKEKKKERKRERKKKDRSIERKKERKKVEKRIERKIERQRPKERWWKEIRPYRVTRHTSLLVLVGQKAKPLRTNVRTNRLTNGRTQALIDASSHLYNRVCVFVRRSERECTSVPVVISRSFGSRVRRGKTNRGGRLLRRFEGLCQWRNRCRQSAHEVFVGVVMRCRCW